VAVKIIMTWDILTGREQEYFEFVVRDFIPGVQRLGMEPTDAWFTMYGDQPQIMVAAQMPDMQQMQRVLDKPEWDDLIQRLLTFVENYQYKLVDARTGFQL